MFLDKVSKNCLKSPVIVSATRKGKQLEKQNSSIKTDKIRILKDKVSKF